MVINATFLYHGFKQDLAFVSIQYVWEVEKNLINKSDLIEYGYKLVNEWLLLLGLDSLRDADFIWKDMHKQGTNNDTAFAFQQNMTRTHLVNLF